MKAYRIFILLFFLNGLIDSFSGQAQEFHRLNDTFEGSFQAKHPEKINDSWQRMVIFGDWSLKADGSLCALNVPSQMHGPLLTYSASIVDVVIDCEFWLPEDTNQDQHFRIFLSNSNYLGHIISAMSNNSTSSYKKGLTLLHFRKNMKKEIVSSIDFAENSLMCSTGEWHTFRLELKGNRAITKVDNVVLLAEHDVLDDIKNGLSINFGKAGGMIRNFKVYNRNNQ